VKKLANPWELFREQINLVFFFSSLGWGETESTWYVGHQPRKIDDDECGAMGGMRIGEGNRSTRRKSAPVLLCSPQIPHVLT
jgi:hypothetical protein